MKRRKFTSVSTLLQILVAVVLFVLLILLILWYQEGLNSYKPKEKTFYFSAGTKIECSEDTKFSKTDKGILIQDGSNEWYADTVPVMFEAENKMTLTANNMLMRPSEMMEVYRVNEFWEVSDKNGSVSIQNDGKSKKVMSGFLYDGDNTYTFLEDVVLHIGAKDVKLPPLSYAVVAYRQYVEYYNSRTEDMEWISIDDSEITVTLRNGDELNLGKDIIHHDGKDSLLFSAVDTLKILELE